MKTASLVFMLVIANLSGYAFAQRTEKLDFEPMEIEGRSPPEKGPGLFSDRDIGREKGPTAAEKAAAAREAAAVQQAAAAVAAAEKARKDEAERVRKAEEQRLRVERDKARDAHKDASERFTDMRANPNKYTADERIKIFKDYWRTRDKVHEMDSNPNVPVD